MLLDLLGTVSGLVQSVLGGIGSVVSNLPSLPLG